MGWYFHNFKISTQQLIDVNYMSLVQNVLMHIMHILLWVYGLNNKLLLSVYVPPGRWAERLGLTCWLVSKILSLVKPS